MRCAVFHNPNHVFHRIWRGSPRGHRNRNTGKRAEVVDAARPREPTGPATLPVDRTSEASPHLSCPRWMAAQSPRDRSAARRRPGRAMARALWEGSISFGLVEIPVGIYTAENREELKFRM